MGPQTCWKSCATLPSRSWTLRIALKFRPLRGRSCGVPAGPIWEKQTLIRASSCKLGCDVWPVRWTPCSFSNFKGHCHSCFFDNILATLKGQKCEIDSCKWSDLQNSFARGAATHCHPFVPTVLFWSLQVLLQKHQRCRWGRGPAGSLAQLSPQEVELSVLRSNSVHCMAEAAGCQLDQFERSKPRQVPRLASLVEMFGQFVRRGIFFSNVKGHGHGCFFDNILVTWWKANNVK